jgi:hypothetical protein
MPRPRPKQSMKKWHVMERARHSPNLPRLRGSHSNPYSTRYTPDILRQHLAKISSQKRALTSQLVSHGVREGALVRCALQRLTMHKPSRDIRTPPSDGQRRLLPVPMFPIKRCVNLTMAFGRCRLLRLVTDLGGEVESEYLLVPGAQRELEEWQPD